MSKKFTPGPTAVYGCTQGPAPVNRCIEPTANPVNNIYTNDAKRSSASFFLFRKLAGIKKIISKYALPVDGQLPAVPMISIGSQLTTHYSLL